MRALLNSSSTSDNCAEAVMAASLSKKLKPPPMTKVIFDVRSVSIASYPTRGIALHSYGLV